MDKYVVFGNPIKHSKSPQIHTAFAAETGQDLSYRIHKVELDKFADAARSFFDNGGKGINITIPFKGDAFEFADQVSDRALRAKAVNTLAVQEDGSIYGDNTDGVGIIRDIGKNLAWEMSGRRILLIGAGGAVRGVLASLLQQKPNNIVIVNRTVSKAQQLAKDFADLGDVRACGYDALLGNQFDLIINASGASLAGELPPLPSGLLSDDGCCYDMMYSATPTPFMRWGAENMAWAVSDGLGMLVEQAAESFCIWRGVRPKTRSVIEMIRAELEASL